MTPFRDNLFEIFRPKREELFDNELTVFNKELQKELSEVKKENYSRKGYIKSKLWEYNNHANKTETNEK